MSNLGEIEKPSSLATPRVSHSGKGLVPLCSFGYLYSTIMGLIPAT